VRVSVHISVSLRSRCRRARVQQEPLRLNGEETEILVSKLLFGQTTLFLYFAWYLIN